MKLNGRLKEDVRKRVNDEAKRTGKILKSGASHGNILVEWIAYFRGMRHVDMRRVARSLLAYYEGLCGGESDVVREMKKAGLGDDAILDVIMEMDEFVR